MKLKNFSLLKVLFIKYLLISYVHCDDDYDYGEKEISVEETKEVPDVEAHNVQTAENHLSAQIFAIVEHYKQDDPVGLPGATVPDPMPIPDIRQSLSVATMHMMHVQATGLSKFRIKHLRTDLNEMKVECGVQLDLMIVSGDYTLSTFFSRAEGPFKVILKNVYIKGNASLGVERDGKIRTQIITMDITFSGMSMDFQNLGFMGSIFQGVVNSASNLVFDAIKPFMLSEAYAKIRTEIDTNLEKVVGEHSFPNSISPLDMAIAEARKKVRNMGYDPVRVSDYNHTVGLFGMQISNTWMTGISSFYRFGNIDVAMENNTVIIRMQVGTQKILGSTQWEVSVGRGMITRAGQAQFAIQHFKVSFEISQSLDVRNRPQMSDLQMELGNIQVRCDGAGTMDYILEFVVNILPNLLRYQIMDAIENPIKSRIQEAMNTIDVEKFIKEQVPEIEKNGFKMNFDFMT